MNADDDDAKHQASSAGRKDRPHVLLGVTGSVAAVKCPEIAVRLVKECRCHVRVLLTEGGANFWQKARSYNESWWDEFLQLTQDGVEGGDVIEVIRECTQSACLRMVCSRLAALCREHVLTCTVQNTAALRQVSWKHGANHDACILRPIFQHVPLLRLPSLLSSPHP
mmetsp:Transcript_4445/g.11677  ORF Transcript_4445/g.11677 Transcript_4445/m.11677 type:complete len:167 (-) Transcript_4445:1741-2241(-)